MKKLFGVENANLTNIIIKRTVELLFFNYKSLYIVFKIIFLSLSFCFLSGENNTIFIIQIPFNASIQTSACNFLEKMISESTDFYGELQEHFKNSSDLLKRDIYCLSPFNGLSHAHLLIQSVFPIFKKLPYIPILYHLIPYLIYGEDVLYQEHGFLNTIEYVKKHFSKESQIFLLMSDHGDYPQQETIALAQNFHCQGFQNIKVQMILESIRGEFINRPIEIDYSLQNEYKNHSLNKQWWIEQFWFRCFLRFSRLSLGFLIFAVPFFILRKKNF